MTEYTEAAPALSSPIVVSPYRHEKTLFNILAVMSLLFWVAITVGTIGIVWIYMLFIYVFVLFAHSALISFLKGNAVRIDADQFADLHKQIGVCCQRLGMKTVPESYLMTGNGVLNAFATRFLKRYYVVLLSDVVDALEDDPDAVNFYIGHELGHIHRKHIANGWWMGPALILPLVGTAYRRAQEYTCDQYGLACCANAASAGRALAVLAAGTRRWQSLDAAAYIKQCAQTGGFWMSVNELASDYPWLCKRMAHLHNPGQTLPSRHPLAWLLGIFMPRMGPGGPLLSLIMLVSIIGILAAIAIPAYQDYKLRAEAVPVFAFGDAVTKAAHDYYFVHDELPENLAAIGVSPPAGVTWQAEMNADSGVIDVTLGKGRTVTYTPSVDENGEIVWSCLTSLPAKAVPKTVFCDSVDGSFGGLESLLGGKE